MTSGDDTATSSHEEPALILKRRAGPVLMSAHQLVSDICLYPARIIKRFVPHYYTPTKKKHLLLLTHPTLPFVQHIRPSTALFRTATYTNPTILRSCGQRAKLPLYKYRFPGCFNDNSLTSHIIILDQPHLLI